MGSKCSFKCDSLVHRPGFLWWNLPTEFNFVTWAYVIVFFCIFVPKIYVLNPHAWKIKGDYGTPCLYMARSKWVLKPTWLSLHGIPCLDYIYHVLYNDGLALVAREPHREPRPRHHLATLNLFWSIIINNKPRLHMQLSNNFLNIK
jgi:hypothetical protein